MQLTKTTKILLSILTAIIIVGGIFLIVKKTKKPIVVDQSSAQPPINQEQVQAEPNTTEEPAIEPEQTNQTNNQTITTQETSNIDTSNWKAYSDKELGIFFEYPSSWRYSVSIFNKDSNEGDQNIYISGQKKVIVFAEDGFYITINTATEDYEEFKGNYYTGKESLEELCIIQNTYDNFGNICNLVNNGDLKILLANKLMADEGSYSLLRNAYLRIKPLNLYGYSGLVFSLHLNSVNNKININSYNENTLSLKAMTLSKNIITKTSLIKEDIEAIEIFDKIISTVGKIN